MSPFATANWAPQAAHPLWVKDSPAKETIYWHSAWCAVVSFNASPAYLKRRNEEEILSPRNRAAGLGIQERKCPCSPYVFNLTPRRSQGLNFLQTCPTVSFLAVFPRFLHVKLRTGKRNTSLAFFTSYERSLLRNTWGSQRTRLTRDSFLPFSSCTLCLQPAIKPVACPQGDLFCHECIVSNLLAQRKEIERLKRDVERRGAEEVIREEEKRKEEEERALIDFERVSRGQEEDLRTGPQSRGSDKEPETERPKKRKAFEFDLEAARKGEAAEREKSRRRIDEEKSSGPALPSFWVPSVTPSTNPDRPSRTDPPKLHPLCPASQPNTKHPLSLKLLTTVTFSRADKSSGEKDGLPTCPSCMKPLSNTSRAMLAMPCGHVVCKACAGKFMTPSIVDPHVTGHDAVGAALTGRVLCYVCETDVTPEDPQGEKEKEKAQAENTGKKQKRRKEEGDTSKRGLVELKSEGTGFAGGGKNVVGREGVVFQC